MLPNTRINVNRWFRNKLFGYIPDKPVIGDKIICLKNHQDTEIVNGQLFIIISQPVYLDNTFTADLKDIATEQVFKVTCSSLFLNKQLEINKQTSKIEDVIVDYGYCITCHKSQGSQWDSVYLFEEPIGIPERWLYTGITRAAEKLIIAKEANLW
jgi:exodeoxyribonuclease-5